MAESTEKAPKKGVLVPSDDLKIEVDEKFFPEELVEQPGIVSENWLTQKPNMTASLIALVSSIFVALGSLVYWHNLFDIASFMVASRQSVYEQNEFWRAWSTLLVHADQKHLLGNLFLFFILGFFLTGYFGLLVFPIMAFLIGGVTNFIVLWQMPQFSSLIGLSGVVFWMGGVWLVLYFLIDRRKTLLQRAIRTLGVALVLLMPSEAFDPTISYQSHLVGFFLGLVFGILFFYFNISRFRQAEINRTELP
jgi:rhomboid protease GluP